MNAASIVSGEEILRFADTLGAIAGDCRNSPDLQAELDADPRAFLAGRGMKLPADADLRVFANTPEVFHLVMPPNPNAAVSDEALAGVAGGSTASTISTLPSCVGTASTLEPTP